MDYLLFKVTNCLEDKSYKELVFRVTKGETCLINLNISQLFPVSFNFTQFVSTFLNISQLFPVSLNLPQLLLTSLNFTQLFSCFPISHFFSSSQFLPTFFITTCALSSSRSLCVSSTPSSLSAASGGGGTFGSCSIHAFLLPPATGSTW